MISIVFALLVLAWFPVDANTFEPEVWHQLFYARIVTAITFAILAFLTRSKAIYGGVLWQVFVMFSIPIFFYAYSQQILTMQPTYTGWSELFYTSYSLVPFVVVSGFALLPLAAFEVILLAVPLMIGVAFISITTSPDADIYRNLGELWLLTLILTASAISGIFQLHLLISLVERNMSDLLTAAYTRRDGERVLKSLFEQSRKASLPFGIAFVDLDHFKSVNDVYGHDAGDRVLRGASHTIMARMRDSDILVRWGGEEFILVAPGATPEAMEKLAKRVVGDNLGHRPDGMALTASIGLAERVTDVCQTYEELIRVADERMYTAKKDGRNRINGFETLAA